MNAMSHSFDRSPADIMAVAELTSAFVRTSEVDYGYGQTFLIDEFGQQIFVEADSLRLEIRANWTTPLPGLNHVLQSTCLLNIADRLFAATINNAELKTDPRDCNFDRLRYSSHRGNQEQWESFLATLAIGAQYGRPNGIQKMFRSLRR